MSSDSASSTPSSAARSRTASQTSQSGVTVKSSRFIDTWARSGCPRSGSRTSKPLAWTRGRPPPDSRTRRAMRLASSTSVGVEVDVVGDEERPRPDGDGAGRRMQPRRSEVGLAAALADLAAQALVLPAADVGQLLALGPGRGARIQVDRDLEPGRDPLAERARQVDAGIDRRVAERDERDDVDRADAWVLALVGVHVDLVDGDLDEVLEGGRHRARARRRS